ncbi:hypothetical protein [Vibrio gazogenes]|uniref:Uncharacterized protein n=1 Tax=Vibrio gazogenes DSM 21264 = NBRC 103151 TaxID=1123492 RepID=A0A1M5F7G8_VIBGA|nr:hypothetical protein [Vibrio gazogenes]USP15440.1 hypothetical protein MKS89_18750 [Vibrio gazogenes]SHF87459.1 hypothetical protein SAMN02745781_03379 [Vibrio gazogenes DSM 21264] [Vibrio gazogenes DSM 21264 = NBRC 103151]SJN54502.1 hypothetical protein BQ6471_01042 [Vibrio gazogenes]
MKKAKVIITILENQDQKIEIRCQCQDGSSKALNSMALDIAKDLAPVVQNTIQNMNFKKKGLINVH